MNREQNSLSAGGKMLFFSKLRRPRTKVRGLLKGLYHIIGHPIKKQKLVFASISLFLHSNSFLSSVVMDDNFSKLAQLSQAIPANIIKLIMARAP